MPARLAGDTHDRLLAMFDTAALLLDGEAAPDAWVPSADLVAQLVIGLDVAAARLVVASLDIHGIASTATSKASHAQ